MGNCCGFKECRFQEGSRVVVFSEDVLRISSFGGFNMWVSEPSPGKPTTALLGRDDCVMVFDTAESKVASYRLPTGIQSLSPDQWDLLNKIGTDPWAWYTKAASKPGMLDIQDSRQLLRRNERLE